MNTTLKPIFFAGSIGGLDLRICVRAYSPAEAFANASGQGEKVAEVFLRPGETYLGFTTRLLKRNGFSSLDELLLYLASAAPFAQDVRTALLRHAGFSPGTYLFNYRVHVPRESSDPVISVTYGPRNMMEILQCAVYLDGGKMYKMTW